KIEALIEKEMSAKGIPGLSVAVGVEGQVRYAKGFGMADLENGVPATATTVYRTASIAKPLTATAVLQLVEKGKLALDAPIQAACAAFPEKAWAVTARQLLSHLGGVRHYRPGEPENTRHYESITDTLAVFKDDPLLHEPGTKYSYSTYAFSVLGCAIEGASGAPYGEWMRQRGV